MENLKVKNCLKSSADRLNRSAELAKLSFLNAPAVAPKLYKRSAETL